MEKQTIAKIADGFQHATTLLEQYGIVTIPIAAQKEDDSPSTFICQYFFKSVLHP